MASDWTEEGLGELFEYRSGLSKPRSEFGSGFPFLSFKDVFYNYFVPPQLTELVRSTQGEREVGSVLVGDVFLTRTSETMDELGMSSVALKDYESATFNGFCKRLRPRPGVEIDPKFAGFYFRSPGFRRAVTAMSSMSTRASLNSGMMDRLTMILPPLDEQRRIANVLWQLTAKIELNRKMNRTLEEMAQAIFKSWFIDFDGYDPADMVDSELGLIPRGWAIRPVGEAVKVVGGSTPSTKESRYWEGGTYAWATPKDLSGVDVPVLLSTERQVTAAGLESIGSGLLPARTFLLSSRAPIGYMAIVQVPVAINQGFIAIPPSELVPAPYLLFWARANMEIIKGRAGGTTFAEISKAAFRPIPMLLPPPAALSAFADLADPIFGRIVANTTQSRTLTTLRDTLLPKLISGEIRVPDAEAAITEAT